MVHDVYGEVVTEKFIIITVSITQLTPFLPCSSAFSLISNSQSLSNPDIYYILYSSAFNKAIHKVKKKHLRQYNYVVSPMERIFHL